MSDDPNFDAAIAVVLQHEGGLVDDPDDPGGLTNFGISLNAHPELGAAWIRGCTRDQAAAWYKANFYDPYRWRDLPVPLLIKAFDAAVNLGPKPAVIALQRASRAATGTAIDEDGSLGALTLRACTAAPVAAVLAAYKSELAAHYRAIVAVRPTQAKFLTGWLNRAYS